MLTIANVEQAAAWDGPEGKQWAENADRYETTSRHHRARLLDTALVSPGEAVLDIGCGTGGLTIEVARRAAPGAVRGVDLSAAMLELAAQRGAAAGLDNVTFQQADAQVHPFEPEGFDWMISSFGAMFFGHPDAAFGNIARALRPGGRLAMLVWRELARNEWLVALRAALAVGRALPEPPPGALGPFSLADPARAEQILGGAGFVDIGFEPLDELIEFGRDGEDAFAFVHTMGIVQGLTQDLGEASKAQALDQLRAALVAHETDKGVRFGSSAWLVTARVADHR